METIFNPEYFDHFPTGLLILDKSLSGSNTFQNQKHLTYINKYAEEILKINYDSSSQEIKERLKLFKKLEKIEMNSDIEFLEQDDNLFTFLMLSDLGTYLNSNLKISSQKFISYDYMIYVKIKTVNNHILISIENISDERKMIENNMKKNIKSQLLLTISHELNNPLNSLCNIVEEMSENNFKDESFFKAIKTNVIILKFFVRNFILSIKSELDGKTRKKSNENTYINHSTNLNLNANNSTSLFLSRNLQNLFFNLKYLIEKELKKFSLLYKYKGIEIKNNTEFLEKMNSSYDYITFKWLLKNILVYFYYKIHADQILKIETFNYEGDYIDIIFEQSKEKINENFCAKKKSSTRFVSNIDKSFLNQLDIETSVKTVNMIKDIIITMSEQLQVHLEFVNDFNLKLRIKCFEDVNDDEEVATEFSLGMSKNFNVFKCGTIEKFWEKYNIRALEFFKQRSPRSSYSNSPSKSRKNFLVKNLHKKEYSEDGFSNKLTLQQQSTRHGSTKRSNNFLTVTSPQINILTTHSTSLREKNYDSIEIKIPTKEIHLSSKFLGTLPRFDSQSSLKSLSEAKSENKIEKEYSLSFEGPSVLVVDDDNFNLTIMKIMLKSLKVECDTCVNGQDCLSSVRQKEYKLIFMDIMMPVMDGIEACEKIAFMSQEGSINYLPKVIMISAHSLEEVIDKVKRIKCVQEFVSKPVRKNKIKDLLEKYYFV